MRPPLEAALLSLEEALRRLGAAFPPAATGPVSADRDDPALDRSAMDGAAMRSADGIAPRRVVATLYAGDPPGPDPVLPGTCVRIMTGACLPAGADTVVPVERLALVDGQLVPMAAPQPGAYIRRHGEQAAAGALLLPAGLPHTAARTGLRAQVGLPVAPLRRLAVAVAPTGDELVRDPLPHQIRDANGPMLAALAHALGAQARLLPPVADAPSALRALLADLTRADGPDILLTSGGVSAGDKDHLPRVLAELGAQVLFHRIRLKPGMPMLAALLGGKVVLGLPGNPTASYLNTLLFLPVAMAGLLGAPAPDPWHAGVLAAAVANSGDRPLLQPCRRRGDLLEPLDSKGSGDLVRLAQADACAWVEAGGQAAGPTRYLDVI